MREDVVSDSITPEDIQRAQGRIQDLMQQVAMGPSTEEYRTLEELLAAAQQVKSRRELSALLARAESVERERSSHYR